MTFSLLSAVILFPLAVHAANDWSVPCLQGSCSYDISNGTVSGSMTISGSSNAISDITSAAGWTILDCSSNATAQDIRAVCTGDADSCNHLYQGGVVGTLVRLPQNCGAMPFARVAKEWTDQNQSIPSPIKAKLNRRATNPPSVRGISLDMNWAAISPSQNGNVSLTVQGSTNAGSGANVAARSSETRGLFGNLVSDVENASSFNISKSNEKTISLDKSFTVFDQSLSCPASGASPAFTGEIKVDVEPKVQAVIDFGVAASGSIVPPKLDSFGLFANFNATLEGILNIDATASASIDSGKITVFQIGLPGLDFPGILTLGPSFNVDVQAMGNFDTDLNMVVDLAYNISNAKLFFPPGQYYSSGDFAPANTNLQLSASPNVASQASVEAHIIPTVQFGLNALDGLAEANVNLDLDTSAKLMLSLQASAKASTSTYGNSSATGSFSGCVDLSSTLAVNAGADGSFFDLFDKSTSVTLFQKTFDLFQKCFGAGSATKMYRVRRTQDSLVRRGGLACLGAGVAQASSIVDEAISAAR